MSLYAITQDQVRALITAGRKRGMPTVDDVRAACGVARLHDLTSDQAALILDRWNGQRPRQDLHRVGPASSRSRRGLDAGEVRLKTDAHNRQRRTIRRLLNLLEWEAEKCAGWLRKRHLIENLETDFVPRHVAVECIQQLEQILNKERHGWDAVALSTEPSPTGTEAEHAAAPAAP